MGPLKGYIFAQRDKIYRVHFLLPTCCPEGGKCHVILVFWAQRPNMLVALMKHYDFANRRCAMVYHGVIRVLLVFAKGAPNWLQ